MSDTNPQNLDVFKGILPRNVRDAVATGLFDRGIIDIFEARGHFRLQRPEFEIRKGNLIIQVRLPILMREGREWVPASFSLDVRPGLHGTPMACHKDEKLLFLLLVQQVSPKKRITFVLYPEGSEPHEGREQITEWLKGTGPSDLVRQH